MDFMDRGSCWAANGLVGAIVMFLIVYTLPMHLRNQHFILISKANACLRCPVIIVRVDMFHKAGGFHRFLPIWKAFPFRHYPTLSVLAANS